MPHSLKGSLRRNDVLGALLRVAGTGSLECFWVVGRVAGGFTIRGLWGNVKLVWWHGAPARADICLPQIIQLIHALLHLYEAAACVVQLGFQALILGAQQGGGCLVGMVDHIG